MGCGATKLQSRVIKPADYHGNINSSVETCGVKQRNNTDNHSTVNDQEEVLVDHLSQSQVEAAKNGDKHEPRSAEEQESFQSQENPEKRQVVENQQQHVNEQQVNNQQDIPRAGSINDEQDEVTRHQTDVKQDLCDYEVSKGSSESQDNTGVAIAPLCGAIVDIQADTSTHKMLCNNDLLTNPQQYCSTARSLSQSPRIVSLQVELGFVNIASADLDLLQSKCNDSRYTVTQNFRAHSQGI